MLGHGEREGAELRRADGEPAVRELDPEDAVVGDERGGELAVVRRPQGEGVRPVGHEPPDLAEVARGREPAGDDHEHALGQPLDLLEDVRREDDRAPLAGEPAEQLDQVEALPRVGAVERLVEQEDARDRARAPLPP